MANGNRAPIPKTLARLTKATVRMPMEPDVVVASHKTIATATNA